MDADRIRNILSKLNEGLIEREDTVALTLLAVLSGQSVFLYGPPGTAKSMIASRVASAFRDIRYFEYLMQRFSTPEDVFGPISISELRRDNYVRKTAGFLPEADIAFLDEIWKSSPAILNTLLTIVNERKFRNGTSVESVPLRAIISASNEFPAENSGLGALYDRFVVRLKVSPVRTRKGFERMISQGAGTPEIPDRITAEEWSDAISSSRHVGISRDALSVIAEIRKGIQKFNKGSQDHRIYVSDRRWVKSVSILRTAAYVCGKKEVTPDECLLLAHMLWSSEEEILPIRTVIGESVESQYSEPVRRFQSWKESFAEFETDVRIFLSKRMVPPERYGYREMMVSHFGKGRSLVFDYDNISAVIPLERLRSGNSFTQTIKDSTTGQFKQCLIEVESHDSGGTVLKINGKRYMMVAGASGRIEYRDRVIALMKRLSELEYELEGIFGGASADASREIVSPFLSKEDITILDRLRTGRQDSVTEMRGRISDLRRDLENE